MSEDESSLREELANLVHAEWSHVGQGFLRAVLSSRESAQLRAELKDILKDILKDSRNPW